MTNETPVRCLPCGRRRPEIGNVCHPCRDNLEWRLNDIQELYALLPAMLIPGGAADNGGGGKPGKRDAGPLPGVETIMTLLGRSNGDNAVHLYWCRNCNTPTGEQYHPDPYVAENGELVEPPFEVRCLTCGQHLDRSDVQQIIGPTPTVELLASWARLVAEERQFASRPASPTVTSEASFLRAHLDWICEQGWVDDFSDEITRAHNTLRDVCSEHRPKPIGTCPVLRDPDNSHEEAWICGETLWVSTHGSLIIQCRSCKTAWDQDHWRILGRSMGPLKRPNGQSDRVESAV